MPRFEPSLVLEGGSIEVNGAGVVLTTEQCLLERESESAPRSSGASRRRSATISAPRHVLWLGDGVAGDDTDGHIDDIARFVSPTTIVCVVEDDRRARTTRRSRTTCAACRSHATSKAAPSTIVTLPMPGRVLADGEPLPASYANFYIANGVVLAARSTATPTTPWRSRLSSASSAIDASCPIHCEPLVWGMGAIHCVTQQQPKAIDS